MCKLVHKKLNNHAVKGKEELKQHKENVHKEEENKCVKCPYEESFRNNLIRPEIWNRHIND